MNISNNRLFIIVIVLLLFSQCTSTLKRKRINLQRIDRNELVQFASNVNPTYQTLGIKYSVNIQRDGSSNNLNGNIRILNDSAIWINFNLALGINLGRALLTVDKFEVVNFRDKSYYFGSYCKTEKMLGTSINYHVLQNILTSTFLWPDSISPSGKSFIIDETVDGEFILNEQFHDFSSNITIDSKSFKIKEFELSKVSSPIKVTVKYNNYLNIDGRILPQNIKIVLHDNNVETKIEIEFNKITIDKNFKIPFKVPNKYETIELK